MEQQIKTYKFAIRISKTGIFFLFVICSPFLFLSFADVPNDSARVFSTLSGSLPTIIKAENSPYLVEADIFVSPGATVTIEGGTVLLFENFTGMHVQGSLYVKGTSDKPVVFTSKNDAFYNPYATTNAAPYDWNGIDVYENAIGTYFENCVVQFTVYGIRSQTENIRIQNSRFLQNGKSNVSIKENILEVLNTPFSYNEKPLDTATVKPPEPIPVEKPVTTVIKKPRHNFLRYSGLLFALGGAATGAWRYLQYDQAKKDYKSISEDNDFNKQNYTTDDWNKARNKYRQESIITAACGGVGALGLLAFSLSFTF